MQDGLVKLSGLMNCDFFFRVAPERCIKRLEDKFMLTCIKKTVKHENKGTRMCRDFTAACVVELIRCINAKEYINILEKVFSRWE